MTHPVTAEVLWLISNTTPVRGETAAVRESWINVLLALGMTREAAVRQVEDRLRRR